MTFRRRFLPLPVPSDFSRPFWEATQRKQLLLQYDADVGRYQFFARPISVYTGKRDLEWRAAAGTGTVSTFTIVHRAPLPVFSGRTPYVVASIELDEGVRIMAQLINIHPADVRIGLRVRLAWEPRGEFNIAVFTPDTGEPLVTLNTGALLTQNAVVVFGDLQQGIIDHARTVEPKKIARAANALARLAKLFDLPVVVTAIPSPGDNGPAKLIEELRDVLGEPTIHQRMGTDAFENAGFRAAIEATQRRVLLVCGVATEIVVQRLSLSALRNGYDVQVVTDACGGFGARTEEAALSRLRQAGGTTTSLPAIVGELAVDFTEPTSGQAIGILFELTS